VALPRPPPAVAADPPHDGSLTAPRGTGGVRPGRGPAAGLLSPLDRARPCGGYFAPTKAFRSPRAPGPAGPRGREPGAGGFGTAITSHRRAAATSKFVSPLASADNVRQSELRPISESWHVATTGRHAASPKWRSAVLPIGPACQESILEGFLAMSISGMPMSNITP
jgi:hypothetical protein